MMAQLVIARTMTKRIPKMIPDVEGEIARKGLYKAGMQMVGFELGVMDMKFMEMGWSGEEMEELIIPRMMAGMAGDMERRRGIQAEGGFIALEMAFIFSEMVKLGFLMEAKMPPEMEGGWMMFEFLGQGRRFIDFEEMEERTTLEPKGSETP